MSGDDTWRERSEDEYMRAAVVEQLGAPLAARDVERPVIGPLDVLLEVKACGICYTDLRVADVLGGPVLPLIPGHEAVGIVAAVGAEVTTVRPGDRVGAHAHFTCGHCVYCGSGEEEACTAGFSRLAGVSLDGGYAEFTVADPRFCFQVPSAYTDEQAAPLLCAGLIGYRSWKPVREARRRWPAVIRSTRWPTAIRCRCAT